MRRHTKGVASWRWAETGVMWPRAKECLERLEAGGGRTDPSPESSKRARPWQLLDFRLLASRARREYISVGYKWR